MLRSDIIAGPERTWLTARIAADGGADSVDMQYETPISRPRLQIGFGQRGYHSLFVNAGDVWRAKVTTQSKVSPSLNVSVALFEALLRSARIRPGDSVAVVVFPLRDFDTTTFVISRPSADSAVIRSSERVTRFALAPDGSILGGTAQPGDISIRRRPATVSPGCGDNLADSLTIFPLPGRPGQALPSADGCWLFTSLAVANSGWPAGIALLRNVGGRPALVRILPLDRRPATLMTLTHDGKLLIVPNARSITFIDTERLIEGRADAIVGTLSGGGWGTGGAQPIVTRDDHYLFTADEPNSTITVVNLRKARASHFATSSIIGKISTGEKPFALALSPDEKRLYFVTQTAQPQLKWVSDCKPEPALDVDQDHPQGAIHVVDVARAVVDPTHSIVGTAPAGCRPVRIALSPSGDVVYVVARKDDALLALNTRAIVQSPMKAVFARVPTGPAPSDVALSPDGATAYVTNSNRWRSSSTDKQTISVIDVRRIRDGAGAIVSTIPTLAYPNQIRVLPNGRTLVWSNTNAGSLQFGDLSRLLPSRVGSLPAK